MAQTVTFNGGSFNIQDAGGAGTEKLTYSPSQLAPTPSYLLKNNDNSTIVGLGFQDTSGSNVTLSVTSQKRIAVSQSTFSLGAGNDTLLIGSSQNSNYFLGNGNNKVTFQNTSTNDTINFGTDQDTLVFGGAVQSTLVQLTTDTSVDTIKIGQAKTPVNSLRITGATDIDVLFIGDTQYTYNSTQDRWINNSDPNDKKNFS